MLHGERWHGDPPHPLWPSCVPAAPRHGIPQHSGAQKAGGGSPPFSPATTTPPSPLLSAGQQVSCALLVPQNETRSPPFPIHHSTSLWLRPREGQPRATGPTAEPQTRWVLETPSPPACPPQPLPTGEAQPGPAQVGSGKRFILDPRASGSGCEDRSPALATGPPSRTPGTWRVTGRCLSGDTLLPNFPPPEKAPEVSLIQEFPVRKT